MEKTGFFERNLKNKEFTIKEDYFNNSQEFVLLTVSGHLDTYNSSEFSGAIREFLELKPRKILILNISSVGYMLSTGIGAMVELNKFCITSKIKLYILGIQRNVEEVFELLGFKSFFNYIDELKNIKQENIKHSKFPIKKNCPHCDAAIKLNKTGSFRCKSCSNTIRVIEDLDGKIIVEKR